MTRQRTLKLSAIALALFVLLLVSAMCMEPVHTQPRKPPTHGGPAITATVTRVTRYVRPTATPRTSRYIRPTPQPRRNR